MTDEVIHLVSVFLVRLSGLGQQELGRAISAAPACPARAETLQLFVKWLMGWQVLGKMARKGPHIAAWSCTFQSQGAEGPGGPPTARAGRAPTDWLRASPQGRWGALRRSLMWGAKDRVPLARVMPTCLTPRGFLKLCSKNFSFPFSLFIVLSCPPA